MVSTSLGGLKTVFDVFVEKIQFSTPTEKIGEMFTN